MVMTNTSNITFDMILSERLGGGEKILWRGAPDARSRALRTLPISVVGVAMIVVSILWRQVALGGPHIDAAGQGNAMLLLALFGIPYVAIGVALCAAPLLVYRNNRRIQYAITNRRAVIAFGIRSAGFFEFAADDISDIYVRKSIIGPADVYFCHAGSRQTDGRRLADPAVFRGVDKPDDVVEHLKCVVNTKVKQLVD